MGNGGEQLKEENRALSGGQGVRGNRRNVLERDRKNKGRSSVRS